MVLRMESTHGELVAVVGSNPGGMARQYRVQFLSEGQSQWQRYASFNHREAAEECLKGLHRRGYQARLINYAFCPTAV